MLVLVGENGAGKSTLMKILAGAFVPTVARSLIDGAPVEIDSPQRAQHLGIGMIYQEFTLVPQLTAVANVMLGAEPTRGGLIDSRAAVQRAMRVFDELGLRVPLDVPVAKLSVGQQQLVEIAKVLARSARIIVMDEPTAALADREIEGLFTVVARLRSAGAGIIYISHRMEELSRIADRIAVMRDGSIVETRPAKDFPGEEIIRAMVGRKLDSHFPKLPPYAKDAAVRLQVEGLTRAPAFEDVTLSVRAGEVVGLAGLIGAGRTEILRTIAGADVPDRGDVRIDDRRLRPGDIAGAIAAGVAFITEDRKAQGLVLG